MDGSTRNENLTSVPEMNNWGQYPKWTIDVSTRNEQLTSVPEMNNWRRMNVQKQCRLIWRPLRILTSHIILAVNEVVVISFWCLELPPNGWRDFLRGAGVLVNKLIYGQLLQDFVYKNFFFSFMYISILYIVFYILFIINFLWKKPTQLIHLLWGL